MHMQIKCGLKRLICWREIAHFATVAVRKFCLSFFTVLFGLIDRRELRSTTYVAQFSWELGDLCRSDRSVEGGVTFVSMIVFWLYGIQNLHSIM
jgi:hypothetical protein